MLLYTCISTINVASRWVTPCKISHFMITPKLWQPLALASQGYKGSFLKKSWKSDQAFGSYWWNSCERKITEKWVTPRRPECDSSHWQMHVPLSILVGVHIHTHTHTHIITQYLKRFQRSQGLQKISKDQNPHATSGTASLLLWSPPLEHMLNTITADPSEPQDTADALNGVFPAKDCTAPEDSACHSSILDDASGTTSSYRLFQPT